MCFGLASINNRNDNVFVLMRLLPQLAFGSISNTEEMFSNITTNLMRSPIPNVYIVPPVC